ncbi:MAG: hypothetical protein M3O55_01080 [Actinomycetota bacterium]|nr:hypothetical protein [Actinomycetota bacterium]
MSPATAPAGDDDELLARLQSGDHGALITLYQRWAGFVHGLALAVTGSPEAAAEITYHVFMQVLADPAGAAMAGGTLRGRLAAATHDRAVRRVRSGRSDEIDDEADRRHLALALSRAASLRGPASRAQPHQRLALVITYLAGHTVQDTARILGLSRAAVVEQLGAGLQMIATDSPTEAWPTTL